MDIKIIIILILINLNLKYKDYINFSHFLYQKEIYIYNDENFFVKSRAEKLTEYLNKYVKNMYQYYMIIYIK